jgi:Spy/CpxP family protein refolding chaperone
LEIDMKTWIKRSLIALVGASVVFGGAAAWAHRQYQSHPMSAADVTAFKVRMVDRIGSRMDLDADQKTKLTVLADRMVEQRAALMAGADPRQAMRDLVAGPSFDRSGAEALLIAKTDAVRQGAPAMIAAFGDLYDSLRPEQQQELRDLMEKGRHGHEGRHSRDHDRR